MALTPEQVKKLEELDYVLSGDACPGDMYFSYHYGNYCKWYVGCAEGFCEWSRDVETLKEVGL